MDWVGRSTRSRPDRPPAASQRSPIPTRSRVRRPRRVPAAAGPGVRHRAAGADRRPPKGDEAAGFGDEAGGRGSPPRRTASTRADAELPAGGDQRVAGVTVAEWSMRDERSGDRSCRSEPSARRGRERPHHAVHGWPDFIQPDQLGCPTEEHAAPFGVTTVRGQMTHVAARQEITNPAFRRQDGPRHGR